MKQNITSKFLNKKYQYGGRVLELSKIIIDLKKRAPNQLCVDRYVQGLLLSQKPID